MGSQAAVSAFCRGGRTPGPPAIQAPLRVSGPAAGGRSHQSLPLTTTSTSRSRAKASRFPTTRTTRALWDSFWTARRRYISHGIASPYTTLRLPLGWFWCLSISRRHVRYIGAAHQGVAETPGPGAIRFPTSAKSSVALVCAWSTRPSPASHGQEGAPENKLRFVLSSASSERTPHRSHVSLRREKM